MNIHVHDDTAPLVPQRQCTPRMTFRYGTEFLNTRSFGPGRDVEAVDDRQFVVNEGDHVSPWKGTFPFFRHHAIVTVPLELNEDQRRRTQYNVMDILETLTPEMTKQYVIQLLNTNNPSLETDIDTIVDAATPMNIIHQEDFTRREIRRLWDYEESVPKYGFREGLHMEKSHAALYLQREWGVQLSSTERLCEHLFPRDEILHVNEIGTLWKLVKVGLEEEVARILMEEELHAKLHRSVHYSREVISEDVSILVAHVFERTSCDYNFHNGCIKVWEICCLCKYLELGSESRLEMSKKNFIRFLSVGEKNPFRMQRYVNCVDKACGRRNDQAYKVQTIKLLWQSFRARLKKTGVSKTQAKRFIVNMFCDMTNMHVLELVEKLPLNGCSRYDPMDLIHLFGKMERGAEAVRLRQERARQYISRELSINNDDANTILTRHCMENGNQEFLSNDITTLLTVIKKMEPGVIHREKHAVIRSKLSFNNRNDILFRITYPDEESKKDAQLRISAVEKEKCQTIAYSITNLNCETTSLQAVLDPEKSVQKYCCLPGSLQVQQVFIGVFSRFLKAVVFILFRSFAPFLLLVICPDIVCPNERFFGYILIVVIETVLVLLDVTCCGCYWCCGCARGWRCGCNGRLCQLFPKTRDKCAFFWNILVQECCLLGSGISANYAFEEFACPQLHWSEKHLLCVTIAGLIYLTFALLGFFLGRWLVFCCTFGCCVVDVCRCRRRTMCCIACCRACCYCCSWQ